MKLELIDLFRLAGRWVSGICLSSLSPFSSVGVTCVLLCLAFKTIVSFNFKLCVCTLLQALRFPWGYRWFSATQSACQELNSEPLQECWRLGHLSCPVLPGFYVDTRDLNSGPHPCTAGTLLTELSSQLPSPKSSSRRYSSKQSVNKLKKSKLSDSAKTETKASCL